MNKKTWETEYYLLSTSDRHQEMVNNYLGKNGTKNESYYLEETVNTCFYDQYRHSDRLSNLFIRGG